ncbi:Indoleamine 2,3-dioxygenase 2 [Merluccius polli]|uniref:Indoleamine 2,3-dioxygenase 2 n=1 Tax=Merluccius polli TaxID=89951 RepID=A0AA47P638_MERPO|nr:Indoleamine 2,3-dioxygenase 2 [Merluccius polli]
MATVFTDSKLPFSLDPYHVSAELGFVLQAPQQELPEFYQPWMDIALRITDLVQSHMLRSRIDKMPLLSTEYLETHRDLRLAHLALSAMTMGYVWQEGEDGTIEMLPQNLAVPLWEVSQGSGLPPILTHADAVLANWRKKDPDGNLELLVTLPGGDSARGFFMVTLLVELAAVPALRSIPTVINGVRRGDGEAVAGALEVIQQSLQDMTHALKLMHVYVEPSIFYGIMRIYLSGWKDNPSMPKGLVYEGVQTEPMHYSGGSAAQSSLLHCFDQLLGVQHEATSGHFLHRMRDYMPPAHRRLIQDISREPSLREFVQGERASNARLSRAFTLCVAQLVALRSDHINMVSRFISIPAGRARQLRSRGRTAGETEAISMAPVALEERGTGGSGIMTFLKTVRDRTGDACLPGSSEALQEQGGQL